MTAVFVYGALTALCGLAPASVFFLAGIIGASAMRVTFNVSADAMVQLSSRATIRGRVVSLWIMVFSAGQALGGPLMGWIAETFGVTVAFLVAGGAPAIAALTVGCVLAHRGRLRLRVDVRSPRRLVTIVRRCDQPAPEARTRPKPDRAARRKGRWHGARRRHASATRPRSE